MSSMSLRDPIVVLEDMLEAVQSIEEYSTDLSFDAYDADKKTKDAVVRNFEIHGEAATHITDEIRVRFPDIPWNPGDWSPKYHYSSLFWRRS